MEVEGFKRKERIYSFGHDSKADSTNIQEIKTHGNFKNLAEPTRNYNSFSVEW